MTKEKPASHAASGPTQTSKNPDNNLTHRKHGHKVSSASADFHDPFQELMERVEQHLLQEGRPEECFVTQLPSGLLLILDDRQLMLRPASIESPEDLPTQLSPEMLEEYSFDHLSELVAEKELYEGLLSSADLAVWLGREKHRKSNVILQFCVSAALGRDFLQFRFAAPQPLRVVLIDFESKTSSLKNRVGRISAAMNLAASDKSALWSNLRVVELRRVVRSGIIVPKFPVPSSRGKRMTAAEIQESADFWEGVAAQYPADLYVIDPLRPLHSADENDSRIETLLAELRRVFRDTAVVVAHHMRKAHDNGTTLAEDMRTFSDDARGSSAIKAHSDVIILQERTMDARGEEIVHLGAFLKDGPDIEPLTLMESDEESFFWRVVPHAPARYQGSYRALKEAGGRFQTAGMAVQVLTQAGVSRATGYRHVKAFQRIGLLSNRDGWLILEASPASPAG